MNYISIFVAIILSVILGFVWYSPVVFGKKWIKLNNIDPKKIRDSRSGMYILPIISSIITASILALLMNLLNATTWTAGAFIGLIVWFGFALPTQLLPWAFSGKKMEALLLETMYPFVAFILMGALIAGWR